jgi:oligopeptide/dipeptide ABC transporter ATP-binding protein
LHGPDVLAVQKVSFDIEKNRCFALVGESGSGKSSVARAMLGLLPLHAGTVQVGDLQLSGLAPSKEPEFRRTVQAVFQDPLLALNPRLSVGYQVEEPLIIHHVPVAERKQRVDEVLDKVRLASSLMSRRPSQLSGGQRQRVCIARALVLRPSLLIADEPVSALDLSVQARILDLLADLRRSEGLTLLFVSHDMDVVRFIADEVGVMFAGRLLEVAPPAELFSMPAHPYTIRLLASVPSRLLRNGLTPLDDEVVAPSLAGVRNPVPPGDRAAPAPTGCPFQPHCAHADLKCTADLPPLVLVSATHRVACFKALSLARPSPDR